MSLFTFYLAGAQVIPEPGSLIGDLLSMDLGGGGAQAGAGNKKIIPKNLKKSRPKIS